MLTAIVVKTVLIPQVAFADAVPSLRPEHKYALSFSKDGSLGAKDLTPEIANSPTKYPDHMRLFAAYHFAGLFEGSGLKDQSQCATSLKLLSPRFTSSYEGVASLIRFFCLSKTNKNEAALGELKSAVKYDAIPTGQHQFIDDGIRGLKDLQRHRHQDFLSVYATFAQSPIINLLPVVRLIPPFVEKNSFSASDAFKIGIAIEAGAKKDFSKENDLTWFPRSQGLTLQKLTLPYCTEGVIACKERELAMRKGYAAIKEERDSKSIRSKNSDFTRLLMEAQASGNPVAWINNSKENQDRYIQAVEKEPMWQEYRKLK